ncbi:tetratricopeptide repeat-containing sensor histidine kinase [uncultured Sunxiuqinia sp.]|uniref:tetratricopeptide repeat-containing sensor histidine kinase n=1 Tax=uncultured Sunxiuqinia sp. TaxID=1573825 RepID=UPI0030DA4639|tara:strand:+ start:967 stop:2997 length:2031 start_codon:yes stop_codon:yes gene_type:complete
MKALILNILLVFVFVVAAKGQSAADSLVLELPELSGVKRTEALIHLALSYSSTDSVQSLSYANEAIGLASSAGDSLLLGLAIFNKGECYYYFEEYDLALQNYRLAHTIFEQHEDSVNLGDSHNAIGLVFYYTGEYNLAATHFYHSLEYLKESTHAEKVANLYSNLGLVFSRIGDARRAIQNFHNASKINAEIKDLSGLAVNYNGLGISFYNLEQYDSSKVYYQKALDLFRQLENRQREAIVLNNIANIYVNTGDSLQHALSSYEQAIRVFDELGDVRSKAYTLEGLGSVHRELGNYTQAIATFQESLNLIKDNAYGYYLQQLNYYDLALTYERMGRIDEAYNAFRLYSTFKDSLLQEERLNQVAELEQQYQARQKEAEIERLNNSRQIDQLKIQRNEEVRFFGMITIVLLVVTIFLMSLAYLNKRKHNDLLSRKNERIEDQRLELEKLNASKNKFFSIIAHDLKNPFHTVMGYAHLIDKEYDRFSDEERKKYAGDIYRSANLIFRLLNNLLDWARSQTGSLAYSPQKIGFLEIYEGIEKLIKPFAEQKDIRLHKEIPETLQIYADPRMLETVMRNLMNNAIKFTHPGGMVKVRVKNDGHKAVVCVEDNGVGISTSDMDGLFQIDSKLKRKGTANEDGSGLGLLVCSEFVRKNGGDIWVESQVGKGSQFYFSVPKSV